MDGPVHVVALDQIVPGAALLGLVILLAVVVVFGVRRRSRG
jgi:hypothetical protein